MPRGVKPTALAGVAEIDETYVLESFKGQKGAGRAARIGASVERVESGTRLVGEAGQTMGEIVTQVRRVSDLITEISAATQEQTSGIGQVSDAVTHLDEVTQQNAALVEQAAAAAQSLRQQSVRLVDSVRVFRVA